MKFFKKTIKKILLRCRLKPKHVRLDSGCQISFDSSFEGYNRIGRNAFFAGTIGYSSYIGEQSHVVAKIGRFTCIAPRVVTVRGTHPTKKWVSVHPAFFSKENQCGMSFVAEERYAEKKPPAIIGNDVWIGDSAIIMDGITIGDGAVIAAGAVVTKNVEPYAIVGGVPAKVIRYRFEDEEIKKLLEIKWWDRPIEWIRENTGLFEDVRVFLENNK